MFSFIIWRRNWQPTPVFLPVKFHGQRSLVGYSPWGHKRVRYILAAPAAAKSLQSCLTLCGPRHGSPPGTPVPGTLQARTLEWVAISFSKEWKWKVKVTQLCPTLCDPMDCSLPDSSVHGILQARILENSHSLLQGIFPTQGSTQVSCITGRFFTIWATREDFGVAYIWFPESRCQ